MSKNYALKAQTRDRAGKGVARALRRDGMIPAVIYGDNKEPVIISLDSNTVNVEYSKGHMYTTLCDMDVEGSAHRVLARDVQLHPVTDEVLHADFLRVTAKTKIAVEVPVNFLDEDKSPGLRDGGTLNVVRYSIEVLCSAMNIPEAIDVSLEGAEQGDTVSISSVTLPQGAKPVIDDRDFAIATIQAPRKLEEVATEGEEGAEGAAAEGEEGAAEGGDAEGGEEKAEGEGE